MASKQPPKRPRKPPPKQFHAQSSRNLHQSRPKPPPKYDPFAVLDEKQGRESKPSVDSTASVEIPQLDDLPDMPSQQDGPPLPPSIEQLQSILIPSQSEPNLFAFDNNSSDSSTNNNRIGKRNNTNIFNTNKNKNTKGLKSKTMTGDRKAPPRRKPDSARSSPNNNFNIGNGTRPFSAKANANNSSNNSNNNNNNFSSYTNYSNYKNKSKTMSSTFNRKPRPPPNRPSIHAHYLESSPIEGGKEYSLRYDAIKSLPQNLRVSFSQTELKESSISDSMGLYDIIETPMGDNDDIDNSQIKQNSRPPPPSGQSGSRRSSRQNPPPRNGGAGGGNKLAAKGKGKPKAPRRLSKRFAGIDDLRKVLLKGSCQCKSIKYELLEYPCDIQHCYCSMCRKMHGSPIASWCPMKECDIRWISRNNLTTYKSSNGASRQFCSKCGANVCLKYSFQQDIIWITPSLFDENNNDNNDSDRDKNDKNDQEWHWSDNARILHLFCSDGSRWFSIQSDSTPKLSNNAVIKLNTGNQKE